MGCWFTRPGRGACFCTEYIRRSWLRGPGEVLAALTPFALGRKMKRQAVLKTCSELVHFLDEQSLFRFSATLCEIRQCNGHDVIHITQSQFQKKYSRQMVFGSGLQLISLPLSFLSPLSLFPLFVCLVLFFYKSRREDPSPTACLKTIWEKGMGIL